MFKSLILIFLFNIFSNVELKNFYDLVVKDLDDKDVSFEKYSNKCVLVVNTEYYYSYGNIVFLNNLKIRMPELEIVAFPSTQTERMSNEEIKNYYLKNFNFKYDIMAPIDVYESDLYKFLTKQSGDKKVKYNYDKYLVSKDGLTTKKYDFSDQYNLQYILEECVGENKNFLDYIGIDINYKYNFFTQYKDKFVLVLYVDMNKFDSILPNLQVLAKVKKSIQSLKIVVFPVDVSNSRSDSNIEILNKFNSKLGNDMNLIDLMAPINNQIHLTTIYKFLNEKADKKEFDPETDMFLILKDSLTVSVEKMSTPVYLNKIMTVKTETNAKPLRVSLL